MVSAQSATRRMHLTLSEVLDSTHVVPAINPVSGDIGFIYSVGPAPQTVMAAIYRRVNTARGEALYSGPIRFVLGKPSAALTPSAGASPSCSHPWMVPIEDGFACFWERRDTTISNFTMTVGGMQIEMAKLKWDGVSRYTKYASETEGKGFVLDNTIIAGDAGGTPRAAWWAGNLVGVVYGHQVSYTDTGPGTTHDRTWAVRAAYLDFSPNANGTAGKPTMVSNRTGGSVSDAVDGGYAAGSGTSLPSASAIDLDDAQANPVFTVGGGLPSCCFDPRGDFNVAYEARNGGTGNGGIVFRIYTGPYRSTTMLDDAAIYSNTASFAAAATHPARRPILASRNWRRDGVLKDATGLLYPPVLLCFGDQTPGSPDSGVILAKTITWAVSNGAAPTIADLTVPVNDNYDGTTEEATLPYVWDSPFSSGCIIQEKMSNVAGGKGHKFSIIPGDNDATKREIFQSPVVSRPARPNVAAALCDDGTQLLVLAYEGQNTAGSGSEKAYAQVWQF